MSRFPDIGEMRVLDLGGTTSHWDHAPVRPASVTILNLMPQESSDPDRVIVQGDVCRIPEVVVRAGPYDLVYSNSVIEHVGGHARRVEMADSVRSMGSHHWVQTPNRYFPIEPHWTFPGFQFLPARWRAELVPRWPMSWAKPDGREALEAVLNTELIGRTEMGFLFPDSTIESEKLGFMVKSLIAVG